MTLVPHARGTTRRQNSSTLVCGVVLAVLTLGCDDEKPEVTQITKTRVLAARVEVEGDPSRASPAPGEAVNVSFLVAAPEPEPAFAYALVACVAADSVRDLVSCSGPRIAAEISVEPEVGAPAIRFVAPEPGPSGWLAVLGSICPNGVPLASEDGASCAGARAPLETTVDFPMDDGRSPNFNPRLVSIALDGAELPAETATSLDCALLPQVESDSREHTLNVALDGASRDPLEVTASSDPARESLLVSYFSTRGQLDHAYSSIDSAAVDERASALWDAPAVTLAAVARLIVVVRDGRGGSDFAERRVCVSP